MIKEISEEGKDMSLQVEHRKDLCKPRALSQRLWSLHDEGGIII